METRDAIKSIQQWLSEEGLEFKTLSDSRAEMHLHVRYPPTRNGHLFNVVIPSPTCQIKSDLDGNSSKSCKESTLPIKLKSMEEKS